MGISDSLTARDTPAGRAFEAKIIFFDCLILVLGCAGLALDFLPLVYTLRLSDTSGQIFFQAPVKWLWPLLEVLTVAIWAVLFFAALYVVQVYFHQLPTKSVISSLKANWLSHLAFAVVAAGIIGNLLTLPGITTSWSSIRIGKATNSRCIVSQHDESIRVAKLSGSKLNRIYGLN